MNSRFFCYNCFLSIIYLNCCQYGILYYVISYVVCGVIFLFIKNKCALKFIRTILCITVSCYFLYKLIEITSGFFDRRNLLIPILSIVVLAVLKPTKSVMLINRYAFVSGIALLMLPIVMYLPQVDLSKFAFGEIINLPITFMLTALPFSFEWKTSVKAGPIFLILNYVYVYSSKIGIIGISQSININFIFSSLELLYICGLYLTVLPVIATCISYYFDQMSLLYKKALCFLTENKLIIN